MNIEKDLSLLGLPASFLNQAGEVNTDVVITDVERIIIDLDACDRVPWPDEHYRERGGLDGWPLWGWVGTLTNRRARIVHVWRGNDKPSKRTAKGGEAKECRHVGMCVNNCSDDVEARTIALVQLDDFYVPIQVEGLRSLPEPAQPLGWYEDEMWPCVREWVGQVLKDHHMPSDELASRLSLPLRDLTDWMANSAARGADALERRSTVTKRAYQFLIDDVSCDRCEARLCRCCLSYCVVCRSLHCKNCTGGCQRCDDCWAYTSESDGHICAQCGEAFCGCARQPLHCDCCDDFLCSECAFILPCCYCRKGYCLVRGRDDIRSTPPARLGSLLPSLLLPSLCPRLRSFSLRLLIPSASAPLATAPCFPRPCSLPRGVQTGCERGVQRQTAGD